MNKVAIYVLIDPFTKEIKYVGKTTQNPKARLQGHIYEAKNDKKEKSQWIKKLVAKKAIPIIRVIDMVNESEWVDWERYYIKSYKKAGIALLNVSEGGLVHPGMIGIGRIGREKKTNQIGRGIRFYRLAQKKSQVKLAYESGISKTHITLIESGDRTPSISVLNRICDNLNAELRIISKL